MWLLPEVAGDGVPLYPTYEKGEKEKDLYGSTYESRQLASVDVINNTHQRIDLFLSIFSLDPGNNLTVIVPFRELPLDVSIRESTDADFLSDNEYDRILEEHERQNLEESLDDLGNSVKESLYLGAVSSLFTPMGIGIDHVMSEYEAVEYDYFGKSTDESMGAGGGEDYERGIEEVARWDFDGTSLRVFSVNSNATLDDLLVVADLEEVPEKTMAVLEEYRDQYIAVIESETSPPIDLNDYDLLQDNVPDTLGRIWSKFSTSPEMSYSEAREIAIHYAGTAFEEVYTDHLDEPDWFAENDPHHIDWGNRNGVEQWRIEEWPWIEAMEYDEPTPLDLGRIMTDLFMSVYGFTDFKGNMLSVTTRLNDDMIYYPLGTSKGWDNPIADTRIILRCDDDRSLNLDPAPDYSAVFDGKSHYVIEYRNENPKRDVTGDIVDKGTSEIVERRISITLHDGGPLFSLLVFLIINIGLWHIFLYAATRLLSGREKGEDRKKVITWKHLGISFLNIIISAPLTLFILFWNPITGQKHDDHIRYLMTYIPFMGFQAIIFIWGVT